MAGMLHGAAGRSPHSHAGVLDIGDTEARALPGVVAVVTAADVPGRRKTPAGYENYPQDPSVPAKITVDDVLERGTAFGFPDTVIETFKTYMHRLGGSHFMIQMRIGGLEHENVMRSMELFAQHVMPALRD